MGRASVIKVIRRRVMQLWFVRAELYRTIANLEHRWRPAAMVIVAGLVVLAFHLVFLLWPDIFLRG